MNIIATAAAAIVVVVVVVVVVTFFGQKIKRMLLSRCCLDMPGPLRMGLHDLLISLHLEAHANSR